MDNMMLAIGAICAAGIFVALLFTWLLGKLVFGSASSAPPVDLSHKKTDARVPDDIPEGKEEEEEEEVEVKRTPRRRRVQ